jgi:hypothetical protein
MSTTARKARKRQHRAALDRVERLETIGLSNRHAQMKQAREHVAATAFVKAPKVGTPLSDRTRFWQQKASTVMRELTARGIKITPKLAKTIAKNDAGRRQQVRASSGYVRNYSR